MKKVLAALLLMTYFTVSTGFVVSLHYCMDRFTSAELGSADAYKCTKCGMHKKAGCCHDEVKVVKLQHAHTAAHPQPLGFDAPIALAPQPFAPLHPALQNTDTPSLPPANGPPPGQPPAYLLHGVFRL